MKKQWFNTPDTGLIDMTFSTRPAYHEPALSVDPGSWSQTRNTTAQSFGGLGIGPAFVPGFSLKPAIPGAGSKLAPKSSKAPEPKADADKLKHDIVKSLANIQMMVSEGFVQASVKKNFKLAGIAFSNAAGMLSSLAGDLFGKPVGDLASKVDDVRQRVILAKQSAALSSSQTAADAKKAVDMVVKLINSIDSYVSTGTLPLSVPIGPLVLPVKAPTTGMTPSKAVAIAKAAQAKKEKTAKELQVIAGMVGKAGVGVVAKAKALSSLFVAKEKANKAQAKVKKKKQEVVKNANNTADVIRHIAEVALASPGLIQAEKDKIAMDAQAKIAAANAEAKSKIDALNSLTQQLQSQITELQNAAQQTSNSAAAGDAPAAATGAANTVGAAEIVLATADQAADVAAKITGGFDAKYLWWAGGAAVAFLALGRFFPKRLRPTFRPPSVDQVPAPEL